MIKSIKHFEEKSINIFEKLEENFYKNPSGFAEYVEGLTEELHKLGVMIIQETLEHMNQDICDSHKRKIKWNIEKHVQKSLVTSLGNVQFKKTLFCRKDGTESVYLLDKVLGMEPHERLSEDAEAKLLEECVETSYRRGGENVSLSANVSKQTVKNKIHALEIPSDIPKTEKKKVVEYLYLDADEDHVSLQFREKKGDLIENEKHRKNNCLITKVAYVYEGIEKETLQGKRNRLINPHYFCCASGGKTNEEFWDEIYAYIDAVYDLSKVKKIYLNADGGAWIKAATKRIAGVKYVLDEFHISKYLIKLTSHMKDSTEDARKELVDCICHGTKKEFTEIVERLKNCLETESGEKRLEESRDYILSNWMPARTRLLHKDGVKGSSTEAHVSHVLSARMSSRPMGWSRTGADKMARLRAYKWNGGDMLELVRYQRQELPKAAGGEYDVLSASEINVSCQNRRGEIGKYMECITHGVSDKIKQREWYRGLMGNRIEGI